MAQENITLNAVCIAHSFDRESLYTALSGRASQIRDVIVLQSDDRHEAFVFDYGVVVFWGWNHDAEQRLLEQCREHASGVLETTFSDELSYAYEEGRNHQEFAIHCDVIKMVEDDMLERLALSHAIAQSAKLDQFENKILTMIDQTAYLPQALAKEGKIPLGRKALAKERGRLYLAKSDVMLQFGLLDTPEFFWEYPEYEPRYLKLSRYLDVHNRIEMMNGKLGVIQELLDMLAEEQRHKHSSLLEWIIIILIAIEILLFFWH